MKLKPSLVLLKVDPVVEQEDESGIFIQDEWKDLPPTGVVQDVGFDVEFCKKGDRVFFARYAALPFPGDTELRLIDIKDVWAIL